MPSTAVKPSALHNGRCVDCGQYSKTAHHHGPTPPSPHPIYDAAIADLRIDPGPLSADIAAGTRAPFVFGAEK